MAETVSLAKTLPILGVVNTLILPYGTVSLMLYTDRDMRVFNRALRTRSKLIGIVQERSSVTRQGLRIHATVRGQVRIPIFQTGCVATIQGFHDSDEGVLVILQGVCRFQISTPYLTPNRHLYHVCYDAFEADTFHPNDPPSSHGNLLSTLTKHPELYNDDHEVLDDLFHAPSNKIITSLVQSSNFNAGEKQALLESKSTDERCSLVTTLLEVNQPGTHITRH